MANNITGLKTAMTTFLANSSDLDAATKKTLRDAFVIVHQGEWNGLVAAGRADNAANRGVFAVEKTFDYWRAIVRSASAEKNKAAAPALEDIA